MPFTWNDRFRLGIADIDKQHQTLLLMLHKALDFYTRSPHRLLEPAAKTSLTRDLKHIQDFLEFHFATEEGYMEQHQYPQGTEHRHEHAALLTLLADFTATLHGDDPVQPQELVEALRSWYDRHVTTHDRRLGEFLKNLPQPGPE